MHVMADLSEVYSFDCGSARIAGLLHDAAKDFASDEQLKLAKEAGIVFRHICEREPFYLHAPVSAHLAARDLGVRDPLILGAISTHTYCGDNENFDSPFFWCLRIADLVEPTRRWEKKETLRKTLYEGRIGEASLLALDQLMEWFCNDGISVHPTMTRLYQDLKLKYSPLLRGPSSKQE
jgi:predicted HD superfamily hydrolase involved in NAD metabolism